MPNGVICGGAVDGSNQLGAMVMGQAITASPAGAISPIASRDPPSVSATSTRSRQIRLASPPFTVVAIRFTPSAARATASPIRQMLGRNWLAGVYQTSADWALPRALVDPYRVPTSTIISTLDGGRRWVTQVTHVLGFVVYIRVPGIKIETASPLSRSGTSRGARHRDLMRRLATDRDRLRRPPASRTDECGSL